MDTPTSRNELLARETRMLPPECIPCMREELETSIPIRFERIVALCPDQIALKDRNRVLRYNELNRDANRLARTILRWYGEEEKPIMLLLENGIPMIIAIFGVLKAGKIYMPVEPSYPYARIAKVLEDSQARLIITNMRNYPLSHKLAQNTCQVINIDEIDPHLSDENLDLTISPDSLAAVYYTSGSTGQPKGVLKNHRSILHLFMVHTNELHLGPNDHLSLLFSCSFGASIAVIYGALLSGARLCFYSIKEIGLTQLTTWLSEEEITFLLSPVTLFRQFLTTLTGKELFPKLRVVVLGGQTVYPKDVKRFRQHFSENCILINRLSLSEASVITQYLIDHETVIPHDIVPVGYPLDEVEVRIIDEMHHDVGVDEVGEIAVRSRYLSPGYWNDPELTRQKFLPDPAGGDKRICLTGDLGRMRPDGCLEYLGRKDFMVKIRGYRVELAELETALYAIGMVKNVVVVAREDHSGEQRLIAYIVPSKQPAPTISELRRTLAGTLPEYMIPSTFVILDALPLTPNGKVDRHALPAPDMNRPELEESFISPRDTLERQIAALWKQVLHLQQIGRGDNFFDLGGHSLLASKLLFEIEKALDIRLPMSTIFQTPTIEGLAVKIRQAQETGFSPSLPPILTEGKLPIPPAIAFLQTVMHQSNTIPSPLPAIKELFSWNPLTYFKHLLLSSTLSFSEKFMGFHTMLGLLIQRGPYVRMSVLPYALGSKWISWCCRQPWVQQRLFSCQVKLLRQVSGWDHRSLHGAPEMISQSLISHFWPFWRVASLLDASPPQFDRWVTIKGLPQVHNAYKQKQGVAILIGHFTLATFIPCSLVRAGFEKVLQIGAYAQHFAIWKSYQSPQQRQADLDASVDALLAAQLSVAEQILAQGGVVCIAGDGYQGQAMMAVPFYGRLRRFGLGFAELALSTGSSVIPAWTFMDITGKIHVRFEEPFQFRGTTHQEQVESLVLQYVAILEKIWAQHLGDIAWNHLEKFLALPEVKDEREASVHKDSKQKQPEFVLYGLEQDAWIGRKTRLRLNPDAEITRMTLQIESHAPEVFHPITVSFKNSQQHTLHTHVIDTPGVSDIQLNVSRMLGETINGQLTMICDKTFVPQQVNPNSSDTRELGVRVVSVHIR